MYVRKQFMKQIFVEGAHGLYYTSFLFHIIGYIVFQFKQIHAGLDQTLLECTYKLFFALCCLKGK